ncbi:MAG: hypothetical protein QF437_30520, partial [Planctomycetota bacterium]|nr:hypothetical protein [Planctomycetota bacterium]
HMKKSSCDLIWACIDDVSSPEEDDRLCRELLSDSGIADAFAEQARVHASLDEWFKVDDVAFVAAEAIESRPSRSTGRNRFAWAAAVALLALLPLLYFGFEEKVAKPGYRLEEGAVSNSRGTGEVLEGELLEIPTGSQARIRTPGGAEAFLKSGTEAIFRGKVAEARQVIYLRAAGGTFKVPPGEGEFRIETPVGHVVVSGTEFSVELKPGTYTCYPPQTSSWCPPEGELMMKRSVTLLAVAVVFGSVEVRIGDETYTLGAGDSRVFGQERPPKVAEKAPAKAKDELTDEDRKIAAEFLEILKGVKAGGWDEEEIGIALKKLGITWEQGMALARKTGAIKTRPGGGQQAKVNVLNRWVGTWLSAVTLNSSRWIPEARSQEEIREMKWILNGRFQESMARSDNHETRVTQRYNSQMKRYNMWTFDSNGGHSYWLGDWDEKSQTMTWQFQNKVIKGTMTERFTADDKYATKLLMLDGEGAALLDIQAENVRILKGARTRGHTRRDEHRGQKRPPQEQERHKVEKEL